MRERNAKKKELVKLNSWAVINTISAEVDKNCISVKEPLIKIRLTNVRIPEDMHCKTISKSCIDLNCVY